MANATTERHTPRRNADDFSFPAAVALILLGTIVVLNTSGNAEPGATATGKKCVGVAKETVDNSGGSAGDLQVPIARGTFLFENSAAADEITNADYGADCYVVDNQTVAKTNGTNTRSVAGKVRGVDASGRVWVEF